MADTRDKVRTPSQRQTQAKGLAHRRANSQEHLEHLTEPEGRAQLLGGRGGCAGEEEQLAAAMGGGREI